MKNKCKFLFALTFAIIFLFYRVDSAVAMENVQPDIFDAQTDINVGAEQSAEPVTVAEPGQNTEVTTEAEQPAEPALEPEAEQSPEPVMEPETEQPAEPALEPETEQPAEPALEPETEQPAEPALASVAAQPLEAFSEPEPEADSVTTGTALIEWLESHKNTGGTVRLADNVVLDGYYCYCPDGPNLPSVFVDTDKYTITVAGEMELMSDEHLIFSGRPDGKGLFYVAEKGSLSMQGVIVESGQCALWQEEGAGLVVGSCHITGDIHYADTSFVLYYNDCICAVVENGQMAADALPAQINCTVNRQGQLSCNEKVPVSWALEGTEEQQEERQRFQVQGAFLDAASAEPVLCTVVYNDHPLTFTDVRASVSGCLYTFQGGYTIPEEYLPITVMAEYSFDGENWVMYEEQRAADTDAGFYIALKSDQDDTAFDIYIRLQWNDNGTSYFSNVLCYAAGDLKQAADIGGGRGGGTSITNPPEEPQKNTDDIALEEKEAAPDVNCNTDEGGSFSFYAESPNTDEGGSFSFYAESPNTDEGGSFSFYAESPNISEGGTFPSYSEPADTNEGQPLYTEPKEGNEEQPSCLEAKTEYDASEKEEEAVAAASVYMGNSADLSQIKEQTLNSGIHENNPIVIAAGFVLLSAIAGIAGFCVHSRSGTNR